MSKLLNQHLDEAAMAWQNTAPMTMVERVAKAIYDCGPDQSADGPITWANACNPLRRRCRAEARAAIDAMRDARRDGRAARAAVADGDRIISVPEWCAAAGISISTGWRMVAAGTSPTITRLSVRRIGIRVRDYLEWANARSGTAMIDAALKE